MSLQLWDMRRILLWRSMTLLLYSCSRTCGSGGEIHGYSNAPIFCKWLIGTGEEMRMKKFTLNLLAPTYLYFLALLRTSFSMYKGSSSDSRRQTRNGYQHPRAPQRCPASPWLSVRALTPLPRQDMWRTPPQEACPPGKADSVCPGYLRVRTGGCSSHGAAPDHVGTGRSEQTTPGELERPRDPSPSAE